MMQFFSRRDMREIVLWGAALVAALIAIVAAMRHIQQSHLEQMAGESAVQWTRFVAGSVPGIELVMAGGAVTDQTLDHLKRLRQTENLFRFRFYDPEGDLVLSSDDLGPVADGEAALARERATLQPESREDARQAAREATTLVRLHEGGTANEPAMYSEAYVALVRDGRVVGVVQVDVDQVSAANAVRAAFARLALVVGLVLHVLAAIGAFYWFRRLRNQRRAEERVRYLAHHDVLSGALNRASFSDEIDTAILRHTRSGTGFAVLCLDLDRFKEVNDSLGHAAGDDVLRQVAQRLFQTVRQGDQLARLGGDEFAILQSGVRQPEDVTRLAKRVIAKLSEPFELSGQSVVCGASVGAAIFGVDAVEKEDLLHKADLALYRAKSEGRGEFSFYDASMDAQLQERRTLTRDLRQALESDQLQLYFQPLYEGDGESLVGYEALVRWRHPQRGFVPPSEFVPLAEDTGLIDPLGRWVLRRACAEAARWPEHLSVAVNLSAAQFRNGDLIEIVARALDESGLPSSRLGVEITESLLMSNTEQVISALRKLSAMGVRIAMDDFGTGYSSLAYLWRFPFDKLKIDRAFTQNMENDPKVSLIVRSIISLAHSLQIRVNAEGVETEHQLETLRRHGCDELQGYLLGRPAPSDVLPHLEDDTVPAGMPDANAQLALPGLESKTETEPQALAA
ncbi:MAG: EAL domain-containing protein [Rhodocyclaceae bacterium]|nr:MAG: EAL domain-containing protein [Rhodocyclaceae bacterium]